MLELFFSLHHKPVKVEETMHIKTTGDLLLTSSILPIGCKMVIIKNKRYRVVLLNFKIIVFI